MVVKFYISMISGNKEMKKRQMKAQLIMESKGVDFKVIDICDPSSEDERRFMQKNATAKNNARNPVPPQFFNDEEYCGDYEGFDDANENDCLEEFLKLPRGTLPQVPVIIHNLSNFSSRDVSMEKEIVAPQVNGANLNNSTSQEEPQESNKTGQEEMEEEDGGEGGDADAGGYDGGDGDAAASAADDQIQSTTTDKVKEDEEEAEEEDEEEEEEEEEDEDAPALPQEDDPLEMSTTVATAERFTEFSYKQLPGEA